MKRYIIILVLLSVMVAITTTAHCHQKPIRKQVYRCKHIGIPKVKPFKHPKVKPAKPVKCSPMPKFRG